MGRRMAVHTHTGDMLLTARSETGVLAHPAPLVTAPGLEHAEGARYRYTIGSFAHFANAGQAIRALSAGATRCSCLLLVTSDAAAEQPAATSIPCIHLDCKGLADPRDIAPKLQWALALATSLDPLWIGLEESCRLSSDTGAPSMQAPIVRHLSHGLENGASALLINTPSADQQLAVSRVLLDAGCDILLTHDVLLPHN
jgi:hypothetical protein